MRAKELDARGLSCPQPVVLLKKALETGDWDHLTVLVDSEVARDNVARVSRSKGFQAEVRFECGAFKVEIKR